MKRCIAWVALTAILGVARPLRAEEASPYGSLRLGPRAGGGLGVRGPRGGYTAGVRLTYDTPLFFSYSLEVDFLHLLTRTITVEAGQDETGQILYPEHEVKVVGLFSVPLLMDVQLRIDLGRARLRAGVGLGAMITWQKLRGPGGSDLETIASFCLRPSLGVDVAPGAGPGLFHFDFSYLWQNAEFEQTGGQHDVDSLLLTVGYSWLLLR